ncbi:MAG: AraC family transcriptional regulator [Holophagales bacterium]|nr:AraC family transcriptional regulator [Holophagales bacterium]
MGQITSLFVWKVVGEVDESADRAALLRSAGIDPDGPIDPSRMVSDTEYYGLFERCAAADSKGRTLPLRVGAAMRCDEYGAFGLAWKSASHLRGSYERAERYARVLTSVSTYEVEPMDGGAFMNLHRDGERRLGMCLSNEATIASIVSISQQASSGELRPLAVHFKHPAPDSRADHEAHFGCPVHFASERDALLVSDETLDTPNKVGDADIVRFFDTLLEADVSKLDDDRSLERQVQNRISRSLSDGVPAISEVARHLGMSGRTLQRRLSEQGLSYQKLVDETRRRLAQRFLRQTDYSLAEVAFMTGFAEQSSFTRAFKRWSGQAPRSYRLQSP